MNTQQQENKYLMKTYKRYNVSVKKSKGQYVWDENGKKYLDFFSGISVCSFGHGNPAVISAIKKQLDLFVHCSNVYYSKPQVEVAKALLDKSFKNGRVFLANTGAEANEGAIKIARKWGSDHPLKDGTKRYEIIAFKNSFHGRTLATLAATGQEKFHVSFKPLQQKFVFAEFNNIDSVKKLINKNTVAVMIELVQGEGGINIADKKFVKDLRKLCDDKNLLLICDEIQCGLARTGKTFAWQHYGIKPDIFTLAKAIANGLPLGAVVADKKVAEVFNYGDHGSTFGGNPVSCAAAVATLKLITPKLLKDVTDKSKYFVKKLNELKKKFSCIKEVRSLGLLVGVELDFAGKDIVEFCIEKGLLINCTQGNVLRFLPPFVITKKDIDKAIKILEDALKWQTLKK
ncbi:aspartate aminotransferase family protein [Candidatus Ruminimicrobiellum ovillum]|uniref:aspartate aminotransferase family protein n=1 Tax=Candidatus Ruminimicrobiellum ovillum TaxID=1947927 RepID=UPI00355A0635